MAYTTAMRYIYRVIILTAVLLIGVAMGAWVGWHVQPRPVIALENCSTLCFNDSQLKGLLLSVGVQVVPAVLPQVIKETNTVIVIESPEPQAKLDYLVIPKRDIKDLSQLTAEDRAYVDDTVLVMSELIQEKHLTNYQVVANGPGRQRLNYLHFHLLSN